MRDLAAKPTEGEAGAVKRCHECPDRVRLLGVCLSDGGLEHLEEVVERDAADLGGAGRRGTNILNNSVRQSDTREPGGAVGIGPTKWQVDTTAKPITSTVGVVPTADRHA